MKKRLAVVLGTGFLLATSVFPIGAQAAQRFDYPSIAAVSSTRGLHSTNALAPQLLKTTANTVHTSCGRAIYEERNKSDDLGNIRSEICYDFKSANDLQVTWIIRQSKNFVDQKSYLHALDGLKHDLQADQELKSLNLKILPVTSDEDWVYKVVYQGPVNKMFKQPVWSVRDGDYQINLTNMSDDIFMSLLPMQVDRVAYGIKIPKPVRQVPLFGHVVDGLFVYHQNDLKILQQAPEDVILSSKNPESSWGETIRSQWVPLLLVGIAIIMLAIAGVVFFWQKVLLRKKNASALKSGQVIASDQTEKDVTVLGSPALDLTQMAASSIPTSLSHEGTETMAVEATMLSQVGAEPGTAAAPSEAGAPSEADLRYLEYLESVVADPNITRISRWSPETNGRTEAEKNGSANNLSNLAFHLPPDGSELEVKETDK